LYAEAFDAVGALDRLQGFASEFGADFYGLPRNAGQIKLVKEGWTVPDEFPFGANEAAKRETLVPLRAGERMTWRFVPEAGR
jgi:dihydroorotase